jgi:DNA-binding MarR family transcriptional regulator
MSFTIMAMGSDRPRASVEEAIVLALFDLTNQLTKLGERLAGRIGLTTQQYLILLHIAGDPNFTVPARRRAARQDGVLASEIASARGVSRANVSALVAGLLRKHYARQVDHPGDRRRKGLVATEAGLRALASVEAARRRANRALLAGLDARQRRQLLAALRSCLDRLWQDASAAMPSRRRTPSSDRVRATAAGARPRRQRSAAVSRASRRSSSRDPIATAGRRASPRGALAGPFDPGG